MPASLKPGDEIKADLFEAGDRVDVSGTSKGKGFAGVIKRHGFGGGPGGHGAHFHRAPGSIGQSADPAKVYKGKRLPGQMGNVRVTAQNLEVVTRRRREESDPRARFRARGQRRLHRSQEERERSQVTMACGESIQDGRQPKPARWT